MLLYFKFTFYHSLPIQGSYCRSITDRESPSRRTIIDSSPASPSTFSGYFTRGARTHVLVFTRTMSSHGSLEVSMQIAVTKRSQTLETPTYSVESVKGVRVLLVGGGVKGCTLFAASAIVKNIVSILTESEMFGGRKTSGVHCSSRPSILPPYAAATEALSVLEK